MYFTFSCNGAFSLVLLVLSICRFEGKAESPVSSDPPPPVSKSSFEDKRCRCVCPTISNNSTLGKRTVHIRDNLDPNYCKCEFVLEKPDPRICALCECTYESRNTTTIKVVVIFIICVVSMLFVYMVFLLCLDPLITHRPKQSSYQPQTNEEVNLHRASNINAEPPFDDHSVTAAAETRHRPPMMADQGRQRSIINRVTDEQKRWKGTVQEQRKQIYDRHSLLN